MRQRNRDVTTRIFARKNDSVGIWNTSTMPTSDLTYSSNTYSTRGSNLMPASVKVAKKLIIEGNKT